MTRILLHRARHVHVTVFPTLRRLSVVNGFRLFLPLLVVSGPLLLAACGETEPEEVATVSEVVDQVAPPPPPPAAVEVPSSGPAREATPPAPEQERAGLLVPLPADQNAVPDANGDYVGIAEAVEGDVIRLGRTRMLLYGIDAVERGQTCAINGETWECWPATVRQLQTIIADGPVKCTPVDQADPYGRILALCEVNGESVNAQMVRTGFAIVFEDEMPEYVPLQEAAQRENIGLWQGTFQLPQEFREGFALLERRP